MQPDLMTRDKSQLLVVDIQARLFPAMPSGEPMLARSQVLLAAAEALGVPIVISEQYPKGLGPTEAAILAAAPSAQVFDKLTFSCARNAELAKAITAHRSTGRDQIVICGIEAHVCVAQTALDLAAGGWNVFVVADAVSSRRASDRETALARFRDCGIGVVTSEMVVFEWLEEAGTDEFRTVSKMLKPL